MLMPSIFGENLFDDWMDFSFPDIDKALYGKHAKNEMKTDVRETEDGYELDIDLPGFKKDEVTAQLDNGYLTIQASKGLDKEQKDSNIRPTKCQVLVIVGLGNLKPAFNHIAGRLFLLRFCRLLDEIRELLHFLTSFLSVQPLRYTR